MRQLVYLAAARRDFADILEYITRESGSLAIGRGFVDLLRMQCRKLASLPGTLGRPRPELRPDIRSFPCKGYVIFFRYSGDRFEVVNVLEGHRDIVAYFQSDTREAAPPLLRAPVGTRTPCFERPAEPRDHRSFGARDYRASVQLSENARAQVLNGRPSRCVANGRPMACTPLRVSRAPSAGISTVHTP